jgi:hypothetical protein
MRPEIVRSAKLANSALLRISRAFMNEVNVDAVRAGALHFPYYHERKAVSTVGGIVERCADRFGEARGCIFPPVVFSPPQMIDPAEPPA